MEKPIALLVLLLSGWQVAAQRMAEMGKDNPVVKISLLPLFDIDNAFVAAAEFPIASGKFSLQPEIGYGTAASNLWYEPLGHWEASDKRTFCSKLQFRSYYREGDIFRFYFGGEYAYKHSTYQQKYLDESRPAPGHSEIRLRRASHSVHGLLGWHGYFSNRLSIDFHIGMGLRMSDNTALTQGLTQTELEAVRIQDAVWFKRSKKLGNYGPYPDFIGAVQLGFILGKLN